MTRTIVVGIDGSPQSLAAADWAGDEAARRNLQVTLLNVWTDPASTIQFSPSPEGLHLWEESQVREAARRISERHPRLAVSARQLDGVPGEVLLAAADDAELTVLGSRGLGPIPGFFLGGTGLHVLARSDRPVVAVRASRRPHGGIGRKVAVGLDLRHPCEPLLAFAFQEAAERGETLHAVTVWNESWLYGYAAPVVDPALTAELRAAQGHELAGMLSPWRAKHPEVTVEESLVEGPVAQRLIESAHDADLLVVGRRRPRGPAGVHLGPVAHAVLHHAAYPIAVVPHD